MKAVVTGAAGGLGKAIAFSLSGNDGDVLAPGKKELDVSSPSSVKGFFVPIKVLIVLYRLGFTCINLRCEEKHPTVDIY